MLLAKYKVGFQPSARSRSIEAVEQGPQQAWTSIGISIAVWYRSGDDLSNGGGASLRYKEGRDIAIDDQPVFLVQDFMLHIWVDVGGDVLITDASERIDGILQAELTASHWIFRP